MSRYVRGVRSGILILCGALGCGQILALGIAFVRFAPDSGAPREATKHGSDGALASVPQVTPERVSSFRPASRVYPYSVISGGIASVTELKNAVASDPVVAEHYRGFDLRKARVIRLSRERFAYVSYRVGEKTFWTTRKLKLATGETLITDGKHTARARCGNLTSDVPNSPVFPGEPTASTFDTPIRFGDPGPADLPSLFVPQQSVEAADPGHQRTFIPLVPVGLPVMPADQSPAQSPPPVNVPEPDTLILLSTGLSSVWLARRLRSGSR